MITVLSYDTTSKHPSIAISRDDDIRKEFNFVSRDDLSSVLIPAIEGVLNDGSAPLKLSDIDVVGIAVGPGLFTGIRVGLAVLKGLLLGVEKPVVPVVTLKAAAYKYREPGFATVPLIDARRDEVYLAGYNFPGNNGEIEEVVPPGLIHISRLKGGLGKLGRFHFVGSGAEVHKEFIQENFPGSKIGRRSFFLAAEICKIAYDCYKKKDYITDLQQLMPFYIRKPDAEQNYIK